MVAANKSISKRLIIDGQLWQTTAWDRGMGKYTLALLEAYNQEYGSHNITIVFNKDLKLGTSRQEFVSRILPDAEQRFIELPAMRGDIKDAKKHATKQLNHLTQSYDGQEIDFLILNIFTFDYCAAFPDNVNKLLLFYDLTPLRFWSVFSRAFGQHVYFAHFTTIFEADRIYSISQATKTQLCNLLGVNPSKVTNIKGARIKRQYKKQQDASIVKSRYILAPTSDFPHKNNLNIVKAFARFNETFANSFQLVLTSDLSEDTKQQLSGFSENIIYAGNVSDDELAHLYDNTELVLCPAITEGLGLPVLEAIYHGKPTVCSSIEVFKEVSSKAFYFCDPEDVGSIERALLAAITKTGWSAKQAEYKLVEENLTWQNSAKLFASNMGNKVEKPNAKPLHRLSVVAPIPSEVDTTLGQLVQSTRNCLAENFICHYYLSRVNISPSTKADFLTQLFKTQDVTEFQNRQYARSQAVLYCIDESASSLEVLRRALALPGVVLIDSKKLTTLMNQLVDQSLQERLFGGKAKDENIIKLLKTVGNQVVIYDRTKAARGWDFGEYITGYLKGQITHGN